MTEPQEDVGPPLRLLTESTIKDLNDGKVPSNDPSELLFRVLSPAIALFKDPGVKYPQLLASWIQMMKEVKSLGIKQLSGAKLVQKRSPYCQFDPCARLWPAMLEQRLME